MFNFELNYGKLSRGVGISGCWKTPWERKTSNTVSLHLTGSPGLDQKERKKGKKQRKGKEEKSVPTTRPK